MQRELLNAVNNIENISKKMVISPKIEPFKRKKELSFFSKVDMTPRQPEGMDTTIKRVAT